MQLSDFSYQLPEQLIARYPLDNRSGSRILHVAQDGLKHKQFADIIEQFQSGDCLILNNTKVMAARLFGEKATGGKLELLIERCLSPSRAVAHIKASKAPQEGSTFYLGTDKIAVQVVSRHERLFEIELLDERHSFQDIMEEYGKMPLPPYLKREAVASDDERYQTVYAKPLGAVAAPTAGLHFTEELLRQIAGKGVEIAYVTLHVGAGTFLPVTVQDISSHKMHSEYAEVSDKVCETVSRTRQQGGKVVAVGTTTLRSLESAAANGELKPFLGDTDLFITPGFDFKVVDSLVTNFHLPESTLLMLVTALGGYEQVMGAYKEAVAQEYRFFSFGDAMWINKANNN